MSRRRRMRVESLEDRRMLAASFTGNYTQDFNSLPTSGTIAWANDTTLDGWYLFSQPAPGTAITSVASGTGSSAVGSFYNFGVNGAGPVTDRALGGVGSGDPYFGSPVTGNVAGWMALALTNDTGNTIDDIYLNYTGEQWRRTSASVLTQTMVVEFGFGASFDLVPSWTSLGSDFDFRSRVSGSAGARDGNANVNRLADINGVVSDLAWSPGSTLWFRWVETNNTGDDHGLAIDDVQVKTLPTLVVDTLVDESDGDYSVGDLSLREALENALPFSKIVFDPSLTSGGPATILLTQGELTIDESLIIEGPGAELLTIDASGNDPTPAVDNGDGSRVFNLYDGDFGNYLSPTISGITITGADSSTTTIGGNENVTLVDCVITGNNAGTQNIIAGYADVVIENCVITDNTAANIVLTYNFLEISGSTISDNTGRAINVFTSYGGAASITSSEISGNTGTGIYASRYYRDVTISVIDTVITNNQAGAIDLYGADLTLVDSTISGNSGAAAAVNIEAQQGGYSATSYYGGKLTIQNTDITNNSGAGVIATSTDNLSISDSDISGNSGIGVWFEVVQGSSSATITNSRFNNNTQGLRISGYEVMTVAIDGSEFNGNTERGGIRLSFTTATITDSLVSGNHSNDSGGGISTGDTLVIRNSTISGNSTTQSGAVTVGYLTLENSTVTGNTTGGSSSSVAGVAAYSLTMRNSIVAGNIASGSNDDVDASFLDVNYSLIGDTSGLTVGQLSAINSGTVNLLDVDPLLGPLQDNGGPTFTHALLAGSPAIDAGDPAFTSPPDYDQRGTGFDRVIGGRIDMGAFEVQAPLAEEPSLIVTTELDVIDEFDQLTSLREAILYANSLAGADEITFDAILSGETILLTQGELVIEGDTTITGLGAEFLTIDASGNDLTPETNNGDGTRIFRIDDGDAENALIVSISGLTLTGGDVAGDGGAISNVENLTLSQSVITGNATGGFRDEPYGNDAYGFSGGGIWSDGVLTVVDSQITSNAASQSGESIYSDRSRGGDGGGIAARGTLTISGSLLATNSAGQGGGIYGRGGRGGAIWFDGSSLIITDSTISGNTSGDGGGTFGGESGHGGGIYAEGSVSLDNVLLHDNQVGTASMRYQGGSGGGMWAAGVIEISNSSISGNSAGDSASSSPYENGGNGGDGGGLFLGSNATIINSTIADNNAGDGGQTLGSTSGHGGAGGGIRSSGTLTILASTISGNRSGEGGGTFAYGTGGRGGAGGGIFAGGGLVMHESSVIGNSTGDGRGVSYGASPGGEGGGIAVLGAMTIHGSTISGNTTGKGGAGGEADGGAGGGIWLSGSSSKQITNSTVSGNTTGRGGADGRRSYAGNGGDGGGIFIAGAGVLTLSHSTITGNTTGLNGPESYGYLGYGGGSLGNGGGIFASTAAVNLNNTIVARNTRGNTDDDDLKGAGSFAPTYSLIGVDTGATITPGTGNQIGTSGTPVDSLLGPLADNGGPTLTHALLAGSPAIDAGDPAFTSPPDYDQRGTGFDRVVGGRIDMGAFEVQSAVSLPGDYNGDGVVTGRDFLAWQRGDSPDPFSSDDLETWQDEYNGGALSALRAGIEDEYETYEDDEETPESLMFLNSYTPPVTPPTEVGSPEAKDLFVESVDLAIEELGAISTYGVREFGELVVRRKPSHGAVLSL